MSKGEMIKDLESIFDSDDTFIVSYNELHHHSSDGCYSIYNYTNLSTDGIIRPRIKKYKNDTHQFIDITIEASINESSYIIFYDCNEDKYSLRLNTDNLTEDLMKEILMEKERMERISDKRDDDIVVCRWDTMAFKHSSFKIPKGTNIIEKIRRY